MNRAITHKEHLIYRLVLISRHSDLVLTENVNGALQLPRLSIPYGRRAAEEIARVIKDVWDLDVVILDLICQDGCRGIDCIIAELWRPSEAKASQKNAEWRSFTDLPLAELSDSEASLLSKQNSDHSLTAPPFSKVGWVDEALAWIESTVSSARFRFGGELRQFNGYKGFCLVRFSNSHGPAMWLKAVGPNNAHELAVTELLAQRYPSYLPPIVAIRTDWLAWVMEEVGISLYNAPSHRGFESAVERLASLQRTSLVDVDLLISRGCFDHRVRALKSSINVLIEFLQGAMGRQTSTRSPSLASEQLLELGDAIERALSQMDQLHIPNTIVHNDFNLGNILVDGPRCVFTDWAEACVGNPFFTFQHFLLELAKRAHRGSHTDSLVGQYKKYWAGILEPTQIERALLLAPLLSAFSFLYGRGDWIVTENPAPPIDESIARSIARYMYAAVQTPQLRSALCN